MRNEPGRLSPRQLGALALTAAEFPIFRVCVRLSWPWVLLGGGAAAGLLSLLTARRNRRRAPRGNDRRAGTGRRWPVLLLPLVPLAAREAIYSFPETADSLLAALLVLALAFAAAWQGAEAAGRCAGILLPVTAALCGGVLVFSLPGLRWEWLRPAGSPAQATAAFAVLLLPGAALALEPALEPGARLPHWPWWSGAAAAAAASAVTAGILSPELAAQPEAFRTLARGVSVLGVMRRFEALVNGAMLMAGFCLCTLLLRAVFTELQGKAAEKSGGKNFEKKQKKA